LSVLSMLCTFVSTRSVQLYTLCNVMYSYIVFSVNAVYIRLNMFSPNVHIMQCNVQLHCLVQSMLCTFVLTCSVQLHTLCNVMYSYIVCSVNVVYIRLNMFSPTAHIM